MHTVGSVSLDFASIGCILGVVLGFWLLACAFGVKSGWLQVWWLRGHDVVKVVDEVVFCLLRVVGLRRLQKLPCVSNLFSYSTRLYRLERVAFTVLNTVEWIYGIDCLDSKFISSGVAFALGEARSAAFSLPKTIVLYVFGFSMRGELRRSGMLLVDPAVRLRVREPEKRLTTSREGQRGAQITLSETGELGWTLGWVGTVPPYVLHRFTRTSVGGALLAFRAGSCSGAVDLKRIECSKSKPYASVYISKGDNIIGFLPITWPSGSE
ncbi:hypothetical protein Tco_0065246 [Tanacetum coccineum]